MRKDETGSAAVEAAVAIPLVLVMVLGLIDAALMLYAAAAFERVAYVGAALLHAGAEPDAVRSLILARLGEFVAVRPDQVLLSGDLATLQWRFRILPFAGAVGPVEFGVRLLGVETAG